MPLVRRVTRVCPASLAVLDRLERQVSRAPLAKRDLPDSKVLLDLPDYKGRLVQAVLPERRD